MTPRPPRSTAEWASLVGATLLVLAVIGLIVAQIPGHDRPAEPTAHVERVRAVGDLFHVDVAVRNSGDLAAANVQVTAEITTDEGTQSGDQVLDFLRGGEERGLVFIFEDDPAKADLQATVTGYSVP